MRPSAPSALFKTSMVDALLKEKLKNSKNLLLKKRKTLMKKHQIIRARLIMVLVILCFFQYSDCLYFIGLLVHALLISCLYSYKCTLLIALSSFFISPVDMSLPSGFGVKNGRASNAGASSSKQVPKVSVSQQVTKFSSPKKKGHEKRKNQETDLHNSKKPKVQELSSGFSYEAPVTAAGDWFAKVADGYLEPSKFAIWQQRNGEQAADACRRAAAELFFHLTCNPSDTEKLRARLDTAKDEIDQLKVQLTEAEKEKAELEKFKVRAEKDISRLKTDADNLRANLNQSAQELTASSEKVIELEKQAEDFQQQLGEVEKSSFAAGFRDFVAGFLAVDPEYDWGKFIPATKQWVDDFRVEEAKAIEEKKMEIELEVAAISANKFLQQPSPGQLDNDEARQTEEGSPNVYATDPVPRLTSGEIPQEIPVISSSQPRNIDSSQDQI